MNQLKKVFRQAPSIINARELLIVTIYYLGASNKRPEGALWIRNIKKSRGLSLLQELPNHVKMGVAKRRQDQKKGGRKHMR